MTCCEIVTHFMQVTISTYQATANTRVIQVRNVNTNQIPSVSLYMSAINAVDKSASGFPLRPPFSAACLSERLGIRLIVVLEMTSPSI
jgi:hypothetical protein